MFTTTYSNGDLGHPQVWLPTPGTLADGTAVSHSVRVGLIGYQPNLTRGAGASASAGYAIACAVGNGMLVSGSSSFGLDVFMQADAVDVAADAARATRGSQYFHAKSYQLLWGPNGYGPTSLPLPWGENADMDYYLQQAGL